MFQKLFTGLLCLLIVGCSSPPSNTTQTEVDRLQKERIAPPATTNKAALTLLDKSHAASQQGNLSKAEAYMERALRLDPRNAVLWHYMAKLRLKQGQLKQAAGLAAKSNSLESSQNTKLQADNWRIIAHSRYQQGDREGAQAAQKTADLLTE